MKSELGSLKEVAGWAQSVLTAWNTGDLPRESLLHQKLREVMIEHRSNIEILEASGTGEYKYGNAHRLEAKLLPGEPWFALRAKDRYSIRGVEAYAKLCEDMGLVDHAAGVRQAIKQMKAWQEVNQDKLKIPD
jgi:hypothetical protein